MFVNRTRALSACGGSGMMTAFEHLSFCSVHGVVGFKDPRAEVQQSLGEAEITLIRMSGRRGRIVVPWKVETDGSPSPYHVSHLNTLTLRFDDDFVFRTFMGRKHSKMEKRKVTSKSTCLRHLKMLT